MSSGQASLTALLWGKPVGTYHFVRRLQDFAEDFHRFVRHFMPFVTDFSGFVSEFTSFASQLDRFASGLYCSDIEYPYLSSAARRSSASAKSVFFISR